MSGNQHAVQAQGPAIVDGLPVSAVASLSRAARSLPARGNAVTRAVANRILRISGWRLTGEIPNQPKLVVVGAPHTTAWDFVVTVLASFALGVRISWVGKRALFRGPLGFALRRLGGVAVDRESPQGFVGAMIREYEQRARFLHAIMPEGTRRSVSEWRTGFYYIARGAAVPVLPVAFDWRNRVLRFGPAFRPTDDLAADLSWLRPQFGPVLSR